MSNELEEMGTNIARERLWNLKGPRLVDVTENMDGTVTISVGQGDYISSVKPTHKIDFNLDENRRFVPTVTEVKEAAPDPVKTVPDGAQKA